MITKYRIVTWIVVLFIPSFAIAEEQFQVISFKTHSRMVVHVNGDSPVEWKNSKEGFELYLKGTSFSDLGAPLGEEDLWKKKVQGVDDPRIKSIQLQESQDGVKIFGKWKFPIGKLTLAHPVMESFEYRDKNPSRYIVDIWVKPGPTLIEYQAAQRHAQLLALVKKNQEEENKRMARRLAHDQQHAEAEDPSLFCEKPLSEKSDIFLEFYPVHQKVNFYQWFPSTTPDKDFKYVHPKGQTKEAQYVRLALKFYSQGKLGLTIRTLDFFNHDFPDSPHDLEMKFLRANALIKLGLQADGEHLLKEIIFEEKESREALYSTQFLAAKLIDKKQALPALENFLWLIEHASAHPLAWVFHLGVAESFYLLKQTEKAAKEYKWIMENAPTFASKAEAAYRIGDLYLDRFQYEQALAAYFHGARYLKHEANQFPSFLINRGETLYQLGQYENAAAVFKEFLKLHPNYPEGWRATYRMGEILGRTKDVNKKWNESREWFYQTVNSYPKSPGATLARLRLVPCGDHGGFNLSTQERFFDEEADSFTGDNAVVMKNYSDLMALAQVRTILTLGSNEQTAYVAVNGLQMTKNPMARRTLTLIANHFFQKLILELLARGEKYDALSTYQRLVNRIPKAKEDLLDYEYLLKLSQAASDLGLGNLAEELAIAYNEAVSPKKPGVPRVQREIASTHSIQEFGDITSILRHSEQNFTHAKSLWVSSKENSDEATRQEIRDLLNLVQGESKYSFEKEMILGLIDEKEKKWKSALSHGVKAQLLNGSPRVLAWLAQLQAKAGDSDVALKLYRELEDKLVEMSSNKSKKVPPEHNNDKNQLEHLLGIPELPSLDSVILSQGEILEKESRWGEAASTYSRAIENGWGGAQAKYEYAKTLMYSGSNEHKNRAIEVLENLAKEPLKRESDNFWKKLAQETLANEKSRLSIINQAKEGKR